MIGVIEDIVDDNVEENPERIQGDRLKEGFVEIFNFEVDVHMELFKAIVHCNKMATNSKDAGNYNHGDRFVAK